MMDIPKYYLFSDIAKTKNFTRSGERLGYSQSGVSHILKSLESEIGFPLFVRSRYGVELTEDAKTLLPLVEKILDDYEMLDKKIQSISNLETGHLTIGTYSSISAHSLPPLLHTFKETYPNIDISLKEGGADDILQWIDSHTVDFGFLSRSCSQSLEWIPLGKDPLMAVLPKDYPLPANGCFPIQDLNHLPFIISAKGTDYDIHHALSTSKVQPDYKYSSTDDHAIISMVIHHLGISILPQLILTGFENQITALPLSPFFFRELGIGMLSYKSLSPSAKKFADFIKENLSYQFSLATFPESM